LTLQRPLVVVHDAQSVAAPHARPPATNEAQQPLLHCPFAVHASAHRPPTQPALAPAE
jgi:hypothetical protein